MDKLDLLVGYDERIATDVQTGPVSTAAFATAPGTGLQNILTGFSVSITGTAPTAGTSCELLIVENPGGTPITRRRLKIPAVNFAPIVYEFKRPLKLAENVNASLNCGNLGVGTVVSIELYYVTRPVIV